MSDANVTVTFSAVTDEVVSGVATVRDALTGLAAPFESLNAQYSSLAKGMASAFDPAAVKPYGDALHDTQQAIDKELEAIDLGWRRKLAIYADDKAHREISAADDLRLTHEATEESYALTASLYQRQAALGEQSILDRERLASRILDLENRTAAESVNYARQAAQEEARQYETLADTMTGAFNTQLRGLLNGTQSWRNAFKAVLEDLLIKFIEWGEATLVRQIAVEAAKTSATAAGVAARASAEESGVAMSLATQGAAMIRSILSSAAETFAGVFGFLAPLMGPFAVGPAAAAQATVASMVGAVASADIGMWQAPQDMLTLVHHNELIMPAAQAAAFRQMLSDDGGADPGGGRAVHIHPTTTLNVSALDSGSVSQWMRANSATLLKSIDEAVRHGAHLGLKRLNG